MSDTYDGPERRSAERLAAKGALAAYQQEGFLLGLLGRRKAERPVPVRNMSSSGACFPCLRRLKAGQKLTMRIRLAEKGLSVVVVAKVIWCTKGKGVYPFQVGVRFVEFKGDAWRILSKLGEHVVKREESSTWRLRSGKGKRQPTEQVPEGDRDKPA